jgi:hypothetical protein
VKDRVSNRSKGYVHTLAMTLATGLTGLFFFFFLQRRIRRVQE